MKATVSLDYGRVIDVPPNFARQVQSDVANAHIARMNLQVTTYKGLDYVLPQLVREWAAFEEQLTGWDAFGRGETEVERLGLLPVN